MTADRRTRLAEALAVFHGYDADDCLRHTTWREQADALLPVVDRMCAEAAADALEDATSDLYGDAGPGHPFSTPHWLRERAAAIRQAAERPR